MEADLGFWAATPLWLRLIGLYVLIGLALALYDEKRIAGDSVAMAIGGTLVAALVAPVTAVKLLISTWTTPKV